MTASSLDKSIARVVSLGREIHTVSSCAKRLRTRCTVIFSADILRAPKGFAARLRSRGYSVSRNWSSQVASPAKVNTKISHNGTCRRVNCIAALVTNMHISLLFEEAYQSCLQLQVSCTSLPNINDQHFLLAWLLTLTQSPHGVSVDLLKQI